ncbi:surface antigen BspA-like [Trichomonas vaginalis G3]|uniref:Surface antigen BspA-like n=1 Tax=Trichomonas vaginalis (strain ATCC PRA-98 / G3) TaxID=412133 RepID=A2FAE6_TRIV3|nr:surface antigen BspA-like [Trichomonas vaginalis G3]|eukprot:XP_001311048.1 surface antigen BspA-like [Trichomonas vaginalis G3]
MILLFSIFVIKDIDDNSYSNDGKTLNRVTDNSSELRISAKCEIINSNCFNNLQSLVSFYFQDNPNLTTIKSYGFKECSNLNLINLSICTKLVKIESGAFQFCRQVKQVIFPSGLAEIGWFAFSDNMNITSIFIPKSLKVLGSSAFANCDSLREVSFEEGSVLKILDSGAFGYTNISSFQIPESVNYVDGNLFYEMPFINLSIHDLNTNLMIENNTVFSKDKSKLFLFGEKQFDTYDIPSSITSLEDSCFHYSKLTSMIVPSTIKRVGSFVFSSSKNLKNVTFLGPLDYIGYSIVDSCTNLEFISFSEIRMVISKLFIPKNSKFRIYFSSKTLFGVKTIMEIVNISISDMNYVIDTNSLVMDFGQTIIYEFWGSRYNYFQNGINIPRTVTTIKENTFVNADFLKIRFDLNSELQVIEDNAFINCSLLQFIVFPSKLNVIGASSFKDCIKLDNITFLSKTTTVVSNAFENCSGLKNVYNMTNVPNFCFFGCTKLSNIKFQNSVDTIGINSFNGCSSLTSINIPSSIRIISEYAFHNCNQLSSINIPSTCNLKTFALNSIEECESLQNISDFQSSKYECALNTIYFSEDENKKQLIYHLSKSIDEEIIIKCDIICKNSFVDCNNVVNISLLPNGVSMIETSSFYRCINLKYISFPYSVETVQSLSFVECNNLRCPVIENQTFEYLEMILQSGISKDLLSSCHIIEITNDFHDSFSFFDCAYILTLFILTKI